MHLITRRLARASGQHWCGSISDRLRGLSTAFYLALVSDRILAVDWARPTDLREACQPALIDWVAAQSAAASLSQSDISQVVGGEFE